MPGGYLQLVAIIGLYTVLVLWPPRRPRGLAAAAFFASHPVNELPGLAPMALVAGTVLALIHGDFASTGGLAILALAALAAVGLLEVARRGLMTSSVVDQALDQELGPDWRSTGGRSGPSQRTDLARVLLAPLPLRPLGVRRIRNVSYGDAGRRNRLDVYHRRNAESAGPVFIHLHGGRFRTGGKSGSRAHCCTSWPAMAGSVSAPPTGSVRPDDSPTH